MKKKLIALALVVAMVMGLSMTAMATESYDSLDPAVTKEGEVKISVVEGAVVYKVDVEWDSLDFTYNFGTWKPDTHTYEDGEAGWNKTEANITVTNHSNAPVKVDATYTEKAKVDGVTVTFTSGTKQLFNAALEAYENVEGADKSVSNIKISGVPAKAEAKALVVGTVKVTISK